MFKDASESNPIIQMFKIRAVWNLNLDQKFSYFFYIIGLIITDLNTTMLQQFQNQDLIPKGAA